LNRADRGAPAQGGGRIATFAFVVFSPALAVASTLQPPPDPSAARGPFAAAPSPAYPLAWLPVFNWSESPVLLDLHQSGGFNDNILNSAPKRTPKASAVSRTEVGALGRLSLGPQRFFAQARIAATDFLDDKSASRHDRQFDLGWDWRAGRECAGRLAATASDKQAEAEQASGPGLDTLRLRGVDQEGRCALYGALGALFAAGAASRRHTALAARALDADAVYGKLGLDYDVSTRDHAEIFARAARTRFLEGQDASALPRDADKTDLDAAYRRVFSSALQARAALGASQAPGPGDGRPRQVGTYSAELVFAPSELWRAVLAASRALGPPVSIRAAAQIAETQSLTVNWRASPKLAFTASVARLRLEGGPPAAGLYGGSTLTAVAGKAVYQLTPFTSLSASVQRVERRLAGGRVPTTVAMIGVDFKPY